MAFYSKKMPFYDEIKPNSGEKVSIRRSGWKRRLCRRKRFSFSEVAISVCTDLHRHDSPESGLHGVKTAVS